MLNSERLLFEEIRLLFQRPYWQPLWVTKVIWLAELALLWEVLVLVLAS